MNKHYFKGDWKRYTTDNYEFEQLWKNKQRDLLIKNFSYKNKNLVFNDNLHPNAKEIYHQVIKNNVESVFECGCGAGHHLINIHKINPKVVLGGCDYSQSQIDLGKKYCNLDKYEWSKNLIEKDMVDGDGIDGMGKYDFVYTQAVTMHLSDERARKFLSNMKRLSKKYIFLVENIESHDYYKLIGDVLPEFEIIPYGEKYISYGFLLKLKS